MHISLRIPEIFRTDPGPSDTASRFYHRGGGTETAARVWSFAAMAGVAITLHAQGADLVTSSGVVVALGAAAAQLTATPAKAATSTPPVSYDAGDRPAR
ncbi:hypothetical protein [Nocardia testacea]|uniref:hypothetical protein n=1 Tax=Nocardia testacea TaxID=248551 RepID=UPI00341066F1